MKKFGVILAFIVAAGFLLFYSSQEVPPGDPSPPPPSAAPLTEGEPLAAYPPLGSPEGQPVAAAHYLAAEEDGKIRLAVQVLAPGAGIEAIRIDNIVGPSALWRSDGAGVEARPITVTRKGETLTDGSAKMNIGPLGRDEELLELTLTDNGAFKGRQTDFRVTVFLAGGGRANCLLKAVVGPVAKQQVDTPVSSEITKPQCTPKDSKVTVGAAYRFSAPQGAEAAKIISSGQTGKATEDSGFLSRIFSFSKEPDEIALPRQRQAERERNAAAQSLLQQIALASVALDTAPEFQEGYVYTVAPFVSLHSNAPEGDCAAVTSAALAVEMLGTFGFRPDPEVAFAIIPGPDGPGQSFVAFAAHISEGSPVYIYDNVNHSGVIPYDANYKGASVPDALYPYTYEGYLPPREKAPDAPGFMERIFRFFKKSDKVYVFGPEILPIAKAEVLARQQKIEEVWALYNKRAEKGNPYSQFGLGQRYHHGIGVPQNEKEANRWFLKAFKWFKKAADKGDPLAQLWLSNIYSNGFGVPRDEKLAAKWAENVEMLRHRAPKDERDLIAAETVVGILSLLGPGRNPSEAEMHFRQAAEKGEPSAQFWLGLMYYRGLNASDRYLSREDSDKLAVEWLRKAADKGYKPAKEMLKEVEVASEKKSFSEKISSFIAKWISDLLKSVWEEMSKK